MQAGSIVLSPLTLTIGAEVDNVDLTRPLPDDVIADLKAASRRWGLRRSRAE